jgi:hypothetical protein
MRLFIGTGVEGLRPEGYTTVDISPENHPDIVADAADLHMIETGVADEFYASHVLEHFAWPRTLLVLAEWARLLKRGGVLKLAVPDMELFAAMLTNGQNPFHVMEMIYGAHWLAPGGPQGHHFGFTKPMLVEILTVLGFSNFDWWNSEQPEAANGWLYADNAEQIGLSINIAVTKESDPLVSVPLLARHIRDRIGQPFMRVVRDLCSEPIEVPTPQKIDAMLFQRLHFKVLEERQRVKHLQNLLDTRPAP